VELVQDVIINTPVIALQNKLLLFMAK